MTAAKAYIAAVGTALPGAPVDNQHLADRFGIDADWIELFIGTKTRHFAVDLETKEQQHTLADLAAQAGAKALAASGLEPEDIGFVVLGTATPDALMPATVNLVADKLGLDQLPTYQLQSGCAGAVQALDLGYALVSSGLHRNGLVLGGDVCAKHLPLDQDFASMPASELVNFVLFGDGAGAAVLTSEPVGARLALHRVLNRLTGLGREPGQTVEWFGANDRDSGKQPIREDYKAIEGAVPVMTGEVVWELLDELGWSDTDLDYLLPPQLSGRMTERIVASLDLPGVTEVSCVADTGNTSNALPFMQLARLLERAEPGQKAIGVAVESSKWIKAGYALEKV
ncbi:3-oxoacyl-[acyl-carrier-protein] synthase-3 [Streptacidiphilus sp. MAP12-33]|uniref:3-oxoacyl-[acyl-carrier-protein] synthase III C-terminal domain-containing protein n=1 Tax=Streptacidiphilus sp. MAP12-33 TaxID=3156266 RepID=UPI0035146F8C